MKKEERKFHYNLYESSIAKESTLTDLFLLKNKYCTFKDHLI